MANTITLEISEEELLNALRKLSPERQQQLLARLREEQKVKLVTIPAAELAPLIGIVSIGGDALEDSERL